MQNEDGYFDEHVAAKYDDDVETPTRAVVDPVVELLVELAGGGRAPHLPITSGSSMEDSSDFRFPFGTSGPRSST